ncbi:membrane hypothetical protein [Desulfosarcina cetonica]|uniref:hypothetical protein n=1 Tax=Desulfosarcina cetonica TaxID=90730 RepID=UPI0006D17F88|nr:hypothetical protein [Desulfosarcina cetonica]VTR71125.1 membrane hypothetical protein [Desulfosarcina cetonica]
MTQSAISVDDLKEFAKHLRLVHFSLLATCIVLVFGLASESRKNTDEAFDQIQRILKLKETTLRNPNWLQVHAARCYEIEFNKRALQPLHQTDMLVQIKSPPTIIKVSNIPVFDWSARKAERWVPATPPSEPVLVSEPKTIGEFVKLWNDVDARYVVVPLKANEITAMLLGMEGGVGKYSPALQCTLLTSDEQELSPTATLAKPSWGVEDETYTTLFVFHSSKLNDVFPDVDLRVFELDKYDRDQVSFQLWINITATRINLHVQEYLASEVGASWKPGRFSTTFPELAQYTTNLESLKLDQVKYIIENERVRTKSEVEIVGIRLPERFFATSGIMFLVAIQLYLLIHFTRFIEGRATQALQVTVPWLALYPGRTARLVYLASAVVLPVFCALCVVIDEMLRVGGFWNSALIITGGCASACIAVLTARSTIAFWRKTDAPVPQTTETQAT